MAGRVRGTARVRGSIDMRYFFHLRNATRSIQDEDGIELASLDAARGETRKALKQLRVEDTDLMREGRGWRLEVTDESGTVLFFVSLDEFQ